MIWPAIWTIAVKVKYLKDTLLCANIYQLHNDWINRKVIPSIFDKYKTAPNTTQKQKTKNMSNREPTRQKEGEHRSLRQVSNSCLLYDTSNVTQL